MTANLYSNTPTEDEVLFLPLGGTGEIGMNLTAYGHDGEWIIIDIGITFGGDAFAEYPVMMADPEFLVARRDRLAGIVLTHGHEDHIGALPYLWRRLTCPVYATPFTAALVRTKLARAGLDHVDVTEIALGERFPVGVFTVEYITMTHSIPEPNAVLLSTPVGAVLHTGDWKLEERPIIGQRYDLERLRRLSRERLLAMVCDSTNAMVPGRTGAEHELLKPLTELCEDAGERIIVTTFASNIARLITLARVAKAIGRRMGIMGQAMERMVGIAKGTGYWPADLPDLVDARELGFLPREEVFAVCTGSQGEPRSAMSRLAQDTQRDLLLDPGDMVIFSSRLIPGNERSVERVQQQLRRIGVRVITDHEAKVHVSGHPAEGDLERLYQWVQPPVVIPVHGTPRHLAANAGVAHRCHVPATHVLQNGDLCRLGRNGLEQVGRVYAGRLSVAADGRLVKVPADVLGAMYADMN